MLHYARTKHVASLAASSLVILLLAAAVPTAVQGQNPQTRSVEDGKANATVTVRPRGNAFDVEVQAWGPGNCVFTFNLSVPGNTSAPMDDSCDVGNELIGDVIVEGLVNIEGFRRANGRAYLTVRIRGDVVDEIVNFNPFAKSKTARGKTLGSVNEVFSFDVEDPQEVARMAQIAAQQAEAQRQAQIAAQQAEAQRQAQIAAQQAEAQRRAQIAAQQAEAQRQVQIAAQQAEARRAAREAAERPPGSGAPPERPGAYAMPAVGGPGGQPFQDVCDAPVMILVRAGYWIDAIQLVCQSNAGALSTRPLRGGTGGAATSFALQPGEQVVAISGTALNPGTPYVYSLQIHTNQRSSQIFGNGGPSPGQTPFTLKLRPGETFAGFHGASSGFLDRIGLIVRR